MSDIKNSLRLVSVNIPFSSSSEVSNDLKSKDTNASCIISYFALNLLLENKNNLYVS
ncbi:MAG: hypothetical protein L3J41_15335 [Melioribacteraceae bacterium]|nr:hypothetical protein [Melioribacteraceae bacterium]